MLRTSSYTIYVDLPGNDQEMLLVHGYTGAFDKVSRRVATYVRSLELRRPPKPLYGDWSSEPAIDGEVMPPSQTALDTLKIRGYLTEKTQEEEEEHLATLATRLHERNIAQIPEYIFMPTYNCNLRCSYCFQDHMRSDPRHAHLLRTIQPAVVDRIISAMPAIEKMHGVSEATTSRRKVGFFGGEPLIEASRAIVEYIIRSVSSLGPASFWAVTNGTDLLSYKDLLAPKLISALQITLDGPRREHDLRRIYADGSGSYDKITANISMALDLGVKISVRLNLDRNNIHMLPELVEDFNLRGWKNYPNFSVYAAPIRPENQNTDAKTTFDTWELDQAISEMSTKNSDLALINRPDDLIKQRARRMFDDPTSEMPNFRESFCSAHTRMYIFDAFADIYACWERTGDPTVRIGRIDEDGGVSLNHQVNALWKSRTVASNPICKKCRYALHCGGGCAVLALGQTGQFHMNFCDGFASRFRASVADAYVGHVGGTVMKVVDSPPCDQ